MNTTPTISAKIEGPAPMSMREAVDALCPNDPQHAELIARHRSAFLGLMQKPQANTDAVAVLKRWHNITT